MGQATAPVPAGEERACKEVAGGIGRQGPMTGIWQEGKCLPEAASRIWWVE